MPTTRNPIERSLMWVGTAAGLTTAAAGALPWFHVGTVAISGFSDGAGWVFALCGTTAAILYHGTIRGGIAAATFCAFAAVGWGAWGCLPCRTTRSIDPGSGLILLLCAGLVGVAAGIGLLLLHARHAGDPECVAPDGDDPGDDAALSDSMTGT